MENRKKNLGFTLIELLIVVAIIAILAAIAVPNFLEAQLRAKYSRTLAEMRTLATAAEAYAVDSNRPPRMTWGDAPFNDVYTGIGVVNQRIYGTLGRWITTPIAYTSKFDLLDQFAGNNTRLGLDARIYTYHDYPMHLRLSRIASTGISSAYVNRFQREFGYYCFMSVGPDRAANDTNNDFWVQYDPTNGSVSRGNIWRSQKSFDNRVYNMVN